MKIFSILFSLLVFISYSDLGLCAPSIISPTPATKLTSDTVTFSWNPDGYTNFIFYAADNIAPYQSDIMTDTSITLTGFPNDGSPIYIILYYWDGLAWQSISYFYQAPGYGARKPSITSPIPGSKLTSSSVIFQLDLGDYKVENWSSFLFDVGTAPLQADIFESGLMADNTITVNNLPQNDSTIYVSFYYWDGIEFIFLQYTYTVVNNKWILSVIKKGNGQGKVTSVPEGINCGTDCDEVFKNATVVTLTAVPDPGSSFTRWSGISDCEDGVVNLNNDIQCTAEFNIFPWNMILPVIINGTRPHCNSENFELCENLNDCYYAGGYWYDNKCNSAPSNNLSGTYLILNDILVKYNSGDFITYDVSVSGNFEVYQERQCKNVFNSYQTTGEISYSISPYQDDLLPTLIRETLVINNSSQISDIAQDADGTIRVYYDPVGYYHSYPDGVIWSASPLQVGKSWSFSYKTHSDPNDQSTYLYSHIADFTVVSKEIVDTKVGKFETYKVYYTYERDKAGGGICLNCLYKEYGYAWVYPQVGIVKRDVTVGSFVDWPCFSYYNVRLEATASTLLKNNLPRTK
ncbi:MAG: hypothetical protein RBT05_07780 [Bacteroidales bacterium]|jgi:hypothetical protein|nr:hypothetical protein [Bacteroidales bacterium]